MKLELELDRNHRTLNDLEEAIDNLLKQIRKANSNEHFPLKPLQGPVRICNGAKIGSWALKAN